MYIIIAVEGAGESKQRVPGIQQPYLHLFERRDIRNKLCSCIFPLRSAVSEPVFDDPLAEWFTGDRAFITNAELFGKSFFGFSICGRSNTVDHAIREGDIIFNPLSQARFLQVS